DYAAGIPFARQALNVFSTKGRYLSARRHIHNDFLLVFQFLGGLEKEQFENYSPELLIEILRLYQNWRLRPPLSVTRKISDALEPNIANLEPWLQVEFAHYRMTSSVDLGQSFESTYLSFLYESIGKNEPSSWVSSVIGEFYRQTILTREQFDLFYERLLRILSAENKVPLGPAILKEGYRATLYLKAKGLLSEKQAEDLAAALEHQLSFEGFSIFDGPNGTYSGRDDNGHINPDFTRMLEMLFPIVRTIEPKKEYSESGVAGFYDPVDRYFPEDKLVVEWDGTHHIERSVSDFGIIDYDDRTLRLRDRLRDESLRSQGIAVLRLMRRDTEFIFSLGQLLDLMKEQNPGMDLSRFTQPL
ncbi:MAG: hypothetical protein AAF202_12930, partial [Pseudomonadota bacterium]